MNTTSSHWESIMYIDLKVLHSTTFSDNDSPCPVFIDILLYSCIMNNTYH